MAFFARKKAPPAYTDHRKYVPHLRRDFTFRCAYCERTEAYLGGGEAFEVDHFHPQSKFPELRTTYENLYYACGRCNRHKSETWPSADQLASGTQFADPCTGDPYATHLKERADGSLDAITRSGEYTNDHIRLSREEVRRWRVARKQAELDLPLLQATIEMLGRIPALSDDTAEENARSLAAIARRIQEIRVRFVL